MICANRCSCGAFRYQINPISPELFHPLIHHHFQLSVSTHRFKRVVEFCILQNICHPQYNQKTYRMLLGCFWNYLDDYFDLDGNTVKSILGNVGVLKV